MPTANGAPSGPASSTASPASNDPSTSRSPTGSRLVPVVDNGPPGARRPPSSRPRTRLAVAQPQLVGRERAGVGPEARADRLVRPLPSSHGAVARAVGDHRADAAGARPSRPPPPSSACRPSPRRRRGPPTLEVVPAAGGRAPRGSASRPGRRGSRSYRPSASVSSTSRRALRISATWAARASLSPKVISSVAVESFSLTTGTMPQRSSVSSVRAGVHVALAAVHVAGPSAAPGRAPAVACRARPPSARCSSVWPTADAGLQLGQAAAAGGAAERSPAPARSRRS